MKTIDFLKEANEKHNNKYTYNIQNDTILKRDKIETVCPFHGIFYCNVYEHLKNGRGCKKCADIERGVKQRGNSSEFIEKARQVHGDKYDYSHVEYVTNDKNINIICHKKDIYGNEHGEFTQSPNSHLNGRGCPKCAKEYKSENVYGFCHKRTSQEEFIEKARQVHGDKYDYSRVEYKNYEIPIIIGCPIHGWFETSPDSHLHSGGCGKCGSTLSKNEEEIVKFLQEKIGEEKIKTRVRDIIPPLELDIFLPEHKIAIEYNGVLWHSEKYGKDCNYHLNKLNECSKHDIKLIHVFEDEYIEHKDIVLNKIQHLIGIKDSKSKIRGDKCIIKIINVDESRDFLNKYHLQGFVRATIHLGAYYNNKLIGVMSFSKLRKNSSEYELVRFASDYNYICYGVGGKLFKYFIKNYNPSYIKSFADRRWTLDKDNNLYTKLGFQFKTFTNPDYTYFCKKISNIKRIHKFNFRKAVLIKKFPEYNFTKNMTENEMCNILRAYKVWNCGLIKYEWVFNKN